MHRPEMHQARPSLWLLAGTGEGPPLADQLLARGWQVHLSLVTAAAALRYSPHPHLAIAIGALGGAEAIGQRLDQARAQGHPYAVVVDATHPFARQISAELAELCYPRGQLLLRLHRPPIPNPGASNPGAPSPNADVQLLPNLEALAADQWHGERLLLAIGARQLARAISLTPGAVHHARILPTPDALQRALAAGLAEERIACLHPGLPGPPPELRAEPRIEAALVRQWGITTIVARQSGGITETCWREVSQQLKRRLILLQRPDEPAGVDCLPQAELLAKLDRLQQSLSPGAGPPGPAGRLGAWAPIG